MIIKVVVCVAVIAMAVFGVALMYTKILNEFQTYQRRAVDIAVLAALQSVEEQKLGISPPIIRMEAENYLTKQGFKMNRAIQVMIKAALRELI